VEHFDSQIPRRKIKLSLQSGFQQEKKCTIQEGSFLYQFQPKRKLADDKHLKAILLGFLLHLTGRGFKNAPAR
jgi:hypothetical protein